jgi:hypothetical protein
MTGQELARLVRKGQRIPTKNTSNLFLELENRELSVEEQDIVRQRVLLNQQLFVQHEASEQKRKLGVLAKLYPQLSLETTKTALDDCDGECVPLLLACQHDTT